MRRTVKLVALLLSHIGLFVGSAVAFAECRTRAQWAAAEKDPLFRVGAALTRSQTDKSASATVDEDLALISRSHRALSADVIRLTALLQLNRLDEARVSCAALGWPRCDPRTLTDMRKEVLP